MYFPISYEEETMKFNYIVNILSLTILSSKYLIAETGKGNGIDANYPEHRKLN